MSTQDTIQRLGLTVIALALGMTLIGCGSSKVPASGQSNLSSRSTPNDNGSGYVGSGSVAECNEVSLPAEQLTAQLTTHYQSGSFILDYINLSFTQVPEQILTTSDHYIQIFRWSEDIPGQRFTNPEAVKMFFIERGTGARIAEDAPVSALSKNVVQNLIATYNLAENGITLSNFFATHIIVLTGMDLSYDALTFALYDQSVGTSSYAWTDALIPAFTANPIKYASEHKAHSLQNLHPMYDRKNSGMSDAAFKYEIEKSCQSAL